MTLLTKNDYTVIGSFHIAEKSCKQDPNLYTASLDVDSLFTDIPLDEAADICIDSLCNDNENTPKITKDVFRNLLNAATKEFFFMINNKLYKQIDTVAMGSPLGPALADIFICSFENKWLENCPYGVKPAFHKQHVDNIYVSFSSLI